MPTELELLLLNAQKELIKRKEDVILLEPEKQRKDRVLPPQLDSGIDKQNYVYFDYNNQSRFAPTKLKLNSLQLVQSNQKQGDQLKDGVVDQLTVQKHEKTILPSLDVKKKEKETAGKKWFDMESTPLTEEIKRDLHIIKSRHVLDPKRHYKRDNTKGLPKFFQIGSIIGGPTDYYNRLTRKEQKQTLVQEIMQDSKTQGYIKRKMEEVVAKRSHVTRGGRKKKRK